MKPIYYLIVLLTGSMVGLGLSCPKEPNNSDAGTHTTDPTLPAITVDISETMLEKMKVEALSWAYKPSQNDPKVENLETGGFVFGNVISDSHLSVAFVTGPGKNATHSRASFFTDIVFDYEFRFNIVSEYPTLVTLGIWHSHHTYTGSLTQPSGGDWSTVKKHSIYLGSDRFLMPLANVDPNAKPATTKDVTIRPYVFFKNSNGELSMVLATWNIVVPNAKTEAELDAAEQTALITKPAQWHGTPEGSKFAAALFGKLKQKFGDKVTFIRTTDTNSFLCRFYVSSSKPSVLFFPPNFPAASPILITDGTEVQTPIPYSGSLSDSSDTPAMTNYAEAIFAAVPAP